MYAQKRTENLEHYINFMSKETEKFGEVFYARQIDSIRAKIHFVEGNSQKCMDILQTIVNCNIKDTFEAVVLSDYAEVAYEIGNVQLSE